MEPKEQNVYAVFDLELANSLNILGEAQGSGGNANGQGI